jgi:hypothetical protein
MRRLIIHPNHRRQWYSALAALPTTLVARASRMARAPKVTVVTPKHGHFSLWLTRVLITAACLATIASVGVPAAYAGTNGQQIALDYFTTSTPFGNSCARYGPATNVTVTGYNQNGSLVTSPALSTWPDRVYLQGWWWRGGATVTWTKGGTTSRYHTVAFIPQYNQTAGVVGSFEMWPNIVAVDCYGSLRKVGTAETQVNDNGWAGLEVCGGHPAVYDEVYYAGYDEYYVYNGALYYRYGLGPNGVAVPSLITYYLRVPLCPNSYDGSRGQRPVTGLGTTTSPPHTPIRVARVKSLAPLR